MRPASPPRRDDDESDDEEEEEDEKIVDLEQRLESVETYASLTSSSAKDDAKNDDASKHSAKLFAKLARLRSALVESRPAGNAASSEGEKRGAGRRANEDGNEIKRLHDRLESVLFQIAVVGNATFAKNAIHYFGRSARAIARDCLVLTFSLGNRYCHSLSRVSFRYALLTPFLSYVLIYIQTDKVYSGLQTNF
jgi:hypothetical protein